MKEQQLIEAAFKNLRAKASIELQLELERDSRLDGSVSFIIGNQTINMGIEVRSEVRSLGPLMANIVRQLQNSDKDGLLIVTNYIPPAIKEELRERNLDYLETAGNCHISHNGLFIHIEGEKTLNYRQKSKGKAFQSTGMKLILSFLIKPALINESYRTMAKIANISISAIGPILEDLEKQKFLECKDDKRRLVRSQELLNRWLELYPHTLKRKQIVGRFTPIDIYKCKTTLEEILEQGLITTSGRINEDSMPSTIYSEVKESELKSLLGIKKAADGEIEVVKPFWRSTEFLFSTSKGKVHQLLNLADAITNPQNQNLCVIKELTDKVDCFLKRNFQEYMKNDSIKNDK
jgi:hypothetical protein